MIRLGNTNQVTLIVVIYGSLNGFLCTVSLYHATLGVSSISNEGLQYAIESLIHIHLVKEHRAK
jgi:hypothetical protein